MFGIRKKQYHSLLLMKPDPRMIDPGPTIGGTMSYKIWTCETIDEAIDYIEGIVHWYKKHNLRMDTSFEPFLISDTDMHEMTVTALKQKIF